MPEPENNATDSPGHVTVTHDPDGAPRDCAACRDAIAEQRHHRIDRAAAVVLAVFLIAVVLGLVLTAIQRVAS